MNKETVKHLGEIADKIASLQAELQEVVDDLQANFDDKSEKWQESENGQTAQAEIDLVQSVIDSLDSAAGELPQP
jgi:hypothetical protein